MKEISCDIIKDILPLYVDDVVSDDTKKMVEEHLEHFPLFFIMIGLYLIQNR